MKDFREIKRRGGKITALTAYDYPTARLLDESGMDIILVGDSVGMVVLGYEDTTDVTLDEMLHHTRAAARGVKQALLVADMPIHTYDTPAQAAENLRPRSRGHLGVTSHESYPDSRQVRRGRRSKNPVIG